jgi:putative sterol carrier protein
MPPFPSKEWCEEAVRLVNMDPESAMAGVGWVGDFGAVVEAEKGKLAAAFAIHCVPEGGKIRSFRVLDDADELDEIEPRYLARAPYSVWKELVLGRLDPIEALVRGKIQVQGDVQQLMERVRYKGVVTRLLEKIETQFVDE